LRILDIPLQSDRWGYGGSRSVKPTISRVNNEDFIREVLGAPEKIHFLSRKDRYHVKGERYDVASVSLGIQAIHEAFSQHASLTLNPDLLWYMIAHELAVCVKQNAERYANFFKGDVKEKKEIVVRDDSLIYDGDNDWMRSINLVRNPLREALSEETLDLFTPRFSTSTPESEVSVLVAFMDIVSSYYKFKWQTMCGIPKIRLEGTPEDWNLLLERAEALKGVFKNELAPYFDDLIPVLREIARTATGGDINIQFWQSIYKYKHQSGGPSVTGWITAFMAYIMTDKGFVAKEKYDWRALDRAFSGISTNSFPTHVSKVPFVWEYYGKMIPMMFGAGIFGIDYDDGFLAPRLGFGVFETRL